MSWMPVPKAHDDDICCGWQSARHIMMMNVWRQQVLITEPHLSVASYHIMTVMPFIHYICFHFVLLFMLFHVLHLCLTDAVRCAVHPVDFSLCLVSD